MIDELVNKLIKSEKKVYIQTHDFPDPDAVASAFGLQEFLSIYGIFSEIVYCGEIQREALKKMISILGIKIFKNNEKIITSSDYVIIVDGCKWSKNVTDLGGHEIAVIDHHLVDEPDDVEFIQINKDLGSCSTIITSYYMEKSMDIPINAATALKTGISRDTDLLTRKVTELDINAYHYLFNYANNEVVNSLLRNNIQLSDFNFFSKTIGELHRKDNIAWYYFKDGCESNLMGIIGDFILSTEEIELSILFANNGDSISISIRSEDPNINAAEVVRLITKEIGAGGGHSQMAGGIIFNKNTFVLNKIIDKVFNFLNV
ncbi:MAG: DHH family phosphoesterase [Spirochaetales bacterium]|nr:DHH family phosphoesterase [Spirochaetales bacterium]